MFGAKNLELAIVIAATTIFLSGNAGAVSITVDDASVYTLSCCTYGLGTESGIGFSETASGNNGNPSLTATANNYTQNNVIYSGSGSATLNYFYMVVGPTTNAYVPVTITGSVSASGTVNSTSQASINYANGGINTKNYGTGEITANGYVLSGSYNLPGSANLSATYDVVPNQQLEITLFVDVNAVIDGKLGTSSFAEADPGLSLSQTAIDDGYSLVLSPNLTSAVPEPSTWAMVILGFASIGFIAYRRKSKPAFIAA
jgi:hypothetical protein